VFELTDYSRLVPKDSLTIDGEKLAGIDDFTIDARRCKAEIRLLNTNQSENQDIVNSLTDTTRLLKDGMETENIPAIFGSHTKALDIFSYERLFYRHFGEITQTWEDTVIGFRVQSIPLRNIIYNTFRHNNQIGISSWMDYINNFSCMIAKTIMETKNISDISDLTQSIVYDYFCERISWFSSYVDSSDTVVQRLFYFVRYSCARRQESFSWAIYGLAASLFEVVTAIPDFLISYVFHGDTTEDWYTTSATYTSNYLNSTERYLWLLSDFFSSTISWDQYNSLILSYISNSHKEQRMGRYVRDFDFVEIIPISQYDIYTPFYKNKNVVFGDHQLNYIPTNAISSFSRVFSAEYIKCCKKIQDNNMRIGTTQIKTNSEQTDSQIPIEIVGEGNLQYWNLYVPVERTFYHSPSAMCNLYLPNLQYRLYMDNININEMLSTPNNYLFATDFTETNWMYFDSIKCKERILLPSEETFVDSIPVFDLEDESQLDNYGLYIYRDYFQKYYTKANSSVTDILVQLKDTSNNKVLFTGLIDFNTVQISKKAITFEAIDAIGLLVDNARKLNGIVHFSQFDTGGDGTIAEKKAGATLKQFIETLVRTPFPYQHSLASSSFDIGNNDGLENKLLDTIDTDKAIIMAIQCAKKLLYVDGTGKIQTDSVLGYRTATIDGQIIEENISQNTDIDELEFDQLKKVAGYDKFLPSIVSFYKSINYRYKKRIDLEIYGQTSEIKLLDKIIYKSKEYFVMEKNINLSNGHLSITLIGEI
jgi:hypothetical protein